MDTRNSLGILQRRHETKRIIMSSLGQAGGLNAGAAAYPLLSFVRCEALGFGFWFWPCLCPCVGDTRFKPFIMCFLPKLEIKL